MLITRTSRSRGTAVALTAAGVVLVAGCGGTAKTGSSPGVASIHRPSSAAVSATPASAERPVIRLDASQEDKTRLQDAYIDCLVANGFPRQAVLKGPQGGYPADLGDFDLSAKVRADIKRNCSSKQPELAIARAKRLDPAYADHLEADVKCLNEHGLKAIVQDDGPALVDGLAAESKAHWLDDCEQQAFASYYSTLK